MQLKLATHYHPQLASPYHPQLASHQHLEVPKPISIFLDPSGFFLQAVLLTHPLAVPEAIKNTIISQPTQVRGQERCRTNSRKVILRGTLPEAALERGTRHISKEGEF